MSTARRIHVEFDVYVPPNVSNKEIMEWLCFKLGETGQISTVVEQQFPSDLEAEFVQWR